MNNLLWKLLSVALAFLIWVIVVTYEDPLTTRLISDIPVEKLNENVITSEMKSIDYREGETTSVRIRGKRSIVDRLSSRDIKAYADLEKKSITGAIDIQIDVPDGVTVIDKMPSVMMVDLENIITVQKEIQYYMEGEPKEGYMYLDPVISPNNIEIQGPESKIALIKSVLVPVNIEDVTRDVTLYSSPQILDEKNNVIRGLEKSIFQVQVQVPIQKYKKIDVLTNLDSLAAEGFQVVNVSLSQDTLQVRGEDNDINGLRNIIVENIGISDLNESTVVNVNLEELLPKNVYIHEDESQIEIAIEVEAVVEKNIEVHSGDITLRRLPEDTQFAYVDDTVYSIKLRGLASQLQGINVDRLAPSIDVADLEPGIHQVDLKFNVPSGTELVSQRPQIMIELTKSVDDMLDIEDEVIEDEVQ